MDVEIGRAFLQRVSVDGGHWQLSSEEKVKRRVLCTVQKVSVVNARFLKTLVIDNQSMLDF